MRRWAAFAVLVVAMLSAGCGGGDGRGEPTVRTIVYSIEGTGTLSTLTYGTDGRAGTETLRNVTLPWTATVTAPADGGPYTFRLTGAFTSGAYRYANTISVDGAVLVQVAGAGDGQGNLENSVDVS